MLMRRTGSDGDGEGSGAAAATLSLSTIALHFVFAARWFLPPFLRRVSAPLTPHHSPSSLIQARCPAQWLARLGAAWIICRNMSDLNNCSVYFVFVSTWYPLVRSGLSTWHCCWCWWSPVHRRIVAALLQLTSPPHPASPRHPPAGICPLQHRIV